MEAGAGRAEIANSVSHGLGLLAALAVLPLLVTSAIERGPALGIVGASVFAATLVLLYLSSTLYHATSAPRLKRGFRVLDHAAIFLLIAGTYTPFTLGALRGAWGFSLLAAVWALALAGVALKVVGGLRYPKLSMALYLGMGWLVVVAARPLWQAMAPWGLFWLVAGGVAYTSGVAFYAAKRLRHAHFIWHLFVIAGSACHTVAVLEYS